MSITLRTNKSSALTYEQLDKNFTQFYYSSSLFSNNTILRLHYTGSNLLGSGFDNDVNRSHDITLPQFDITIPEAVAAGESKNIQYNSNSQFAGSSNFVYDDANTRVGIGTKVPSVPLHIKYPGASQGAIIRLNAHPTIDTDVSGTAFVEFYKGSEIIGKLGKVDQIESDNLYFSNNRVLEDNSKGKIIINFPVSGEDPTTNISTTFHHNGAGEALVGIGTTNPDRNLNINGNRGIGINSLTNPNVSFISAIPESIYNSLNTVGNKKLIPNGSSTSGLLMSSPEDTTGGNVVIAINSDTVDKNEGVNIISANQGSYTDSTVVASFQASGKVGINTNFPQDVGLTVAGNISGSGTLQVGTVGNASAYTDVSLIGVSSTGLVEKIAAVASPVPVGGIIIWSGAHNAVPAGWAVCDGSVSNGQTTPNLVSRFIMGADDGSNVSVGTTGGSADAVVVTHSHTTTVNDTGHFHTAGGANGNVDNQGLSPFEVTRDGREEVVNTDSATTGISVGVNSAGESGTNKNLPPYYALCYIMYVGS